MTDNSTTVVNCKNSIQCNIYGPCSIDSDGFCSDIASLQHEQGVLELVAPQIASAQHLTYQLSKNAAGKHVFMIVGPRQARLQINGREIEMGEIIDYFDAKSKKPDASVNPVRLPVVLPRVKVCGDKIRILSLFDGGLYGDVTIAKERLADSLTVNVNDGQTLWLPDDAVFDNLQLNICRGSVHAKNVRVRNLGIVCFDGSVNGLHAIRTAHLVSIGSSTVNVASDSSAASRIHVHGGSITLNGRQWLPDNAMQQRQE